MEIISSMSVITNGALIIFSMKILKGYDFNIQLWAFILFQWVNWILQVSQSRKLKIFLPAYIHIFFYRLLLRSILYHIIKKQLPFN